MTPSHCVLCNHPVRPGHVTIAEAPGTRTHRGRGLCRTCFYEERAAGNIPPSTGRRGRPPANPDPDAVPSTYVFDPEPARRALDLWLTDRRRRLAKQGVMA